jgi:hypothetical protein
MNAILKQGEEIQGSDIAVIKLQPGLDADTTVYICSAGCQQACDE